MARSLQRSCMNVYECNINEIQAMCNSRIFNSEKHYATENSSNFQLFPKLKKTLKGIYFNIEDEVKIAAKNFISRFLR